MKKSKGVALFYTTQAAMKSERTLTRAGIPGKLIPTPREFSSDCGIALQFDWDSSSQVRALLAEAGVEVASFHSL